jgi:Leucine-rich repeat (LRR) protein
LATTGLTDRHIRYLKGLTHLKSLTFWGSADKLTDASLASIAELKNLEELYFVMTGPKFTGGGFAHLKRFKHLRKLDLGFTQISDARYLMELPQLEFAKPVTLTVENMKALGSLRHLKSLGITLPSPPSGSIDDPAAASYLGALSSLQEFSFCGSAPGRYVSDEEVACLESLGRLKKLHVGGSKHLTDRSLTSISKLDQLEFLDFSVFDNEGVSKGGLKQLSGLTNLHTLDVKVHPVVTGPANGVTLDFSTLTNLNTLTLSGMSLQDADVASLAGLRHLEWLTLEGTFTEGGLRFLRNLSNLKHLSIGDLSCTEGDHLDHLGRLVKLNDLTLRGRITDAALRRLAGLPSLWSLRVVTDEPIWPKTVTHLKQNLPAIEYIHIDKPSQWVRVQTKQPLRQRERSSVNPPRANRRTSRERRRRR